MLFALFYECILWILSLFFIPKMLIQMGLQGKYRKSFFKRWGKGFPSIEKGKKPLVWIHAVSVGETKAVAPLAKKMLEKEPGTLFVISSVTETGHEEAKKTLPFAHYHLYLPFDFRKKMDAILDRTKPDLVLFCETDLWYNFMRAAKNVGAEIALVNGKISERSFKRLQTFSPFSRRLFSMIDLFCVQGKDYQKRFAALQVPSHKIHVTGNIKLDTESKKLSLEEKAALRERLGIALSDLVIVAGSTHDIEEKILLEASKKLWKLFPRLKVIFVPRHPERFSKVAEIIRKEEVSLRIYSERSSGNAQAILIDAMGLLKDCYQIGDVAVVCGSFTEKVGGHNILEPCEFGVPVVFGPYLHSQPDFLTLCREYESGIQTEKEGLANVLETLLSNRSMRQEMGVRGKTLIQEMRGATENTLKLVCERLKWKKLEKNT